MRDVPEHGTDRSKRACDAVLTHFAGLGTDAIGKWVAIRLSDGGTDNVAYPTRDDAIRHQLHENFCAYHSILPGGANPQDMEKFLRYTEALYSRGMRPMQNQDVMPYIHMPHSREAL